MSLAQSATEALPAESDEEVVSSAVEGIQAVAEVIAITETTPTIVVPKRRGRPKGSKNKERADTGFASDIEAPKRTWTRRKAACTTEEFMNLIVEPIMGQVAAGRIKKSIGMITAAVCGRLSSLYFTTATSPLQTLSSDITRFRKQPVYNNEQIDGAKQVIASETPLNQIQIPVFAQFNENFNTPKIMVDSFTSLCQKHGINSDPFTTTGGTINLSEGFIKTVTEFALDKELWAEKPLIVHTPKQ